VNHHLLSGCREDVLRKVNGAWKMRRRTIVVDANVLLTRTSEPSSKGQNPISVLPLKAKRVLAEIDAVGIRIARVHELGDRLGLRELTPTGARAAWASARP
jgi:hypothetical protein